MSSARVDFVEVENFFESRIPDYQQECFWVTIFLLLGAIFWFLVLPIVMSQEEEVIVEVNAQQRQRDDDKKTKKNKRNSTVAGGDTTTTTFAVHRRQVVPLWANNMSVLGFMVTAVMIVSRLSPYNYYSPRRVFVFPLLTAEDCQSILEMANHAATTNYQQALAWTNTSSTNTTFPLTGDEETLKDFLRQPFGWHKFRHLRYPTTDLNLITDPFSSVNRTWLTEKILDKRLGPMISRLYGVPEASVRAIDMFVVRYDADVQTHLERHFDEGHISFTVLLTDTFQGGGTRFWKRQPHKAPFAHVAPTKVGTVITNHALIDHEGYHITQGTRIIFVGFTEVDRHDPFVKDPGKDAPTGLSLYASWLNVAWLHVKFKTGYFSAYERINRGERSTWLDSLYMRLLFRDMTDLLGYLGDVTAPHQVEYLVKDENADAFLAALDLAYEQRQQMQHESNMPPSKHANWWKGQMVNLDFMGKVDSHWITRADRKNRFAEEL